jgi:Family of unknown function (DUF6580)
MSRALVLTALVLVAAFSRILQHMPNFSPMLAIALFAVAYFRRWWVGLLTPLLALLLSDVALEIITRWRLLSGWIVEGTGFYSWMWAIYASTAIAAALGLFLRRERTVFNVSATAIGSAIVFFLLSNFACWLTDLFGYPHTVAGLLDCYIAGLPYFRNTLLSTIGFAGVLFGGAALVERWKPAAQPVAS